jgi:DNA-binding response OmpR family regulator
MRRILLVDDDDSFRKMLRLTLVKLGYDVLEAGDGKEALRLIHEAPPDVVMTDLIMPEKEGLETIQALRRTHPSVKIIAMSGGGRINARDFLVVAKLFGAHRTLIKPFSNQEMTAALDEL